ncbi:16S rRNA (cytosine(967)-C(5))-methyltransferase RsmB [Ruminococcus sp. 5_1_39BFAA]|uniref:16S rRNA (cytosine(967)-C(5))-methyltransferase RsmB n=1 Tax=Ruminococcus sp. 5_1_39BFAA TaxID=457412 RepID=UPI003564CFCB
MTSGINSREMILEILLQIEEEGEHSHIAIRNALSKYQFLPKQERAFITRVCEGTLEYRIQIDYIIDSFSKVTVDKMKPAIREILRSAVYQLKFMDSVPDSAVCNEAVKLAQRKGFYNLKPFVNGVLRTVSREMSNLKFPKKEDNVVRYLSVRYSMPEQLVNRWLDAYGEEVTEKMLADFLEEKPTTVRCRTYLNSQKAIYESLVSQGVKVEQAPYLPYAYNISGFNHILALDAFINGKILVQDVSSMLVAEAANPQKGDYVIDVCAAPGGKSLHIGDKMEGFGTVDARDVSQYKVNLIEENIQRTNSINVQARVQDATLFDQDSELLADIVLADVPCSGYGVIGKKPEIKYRVTPQKQDEIVILQRTILDRASNYVKPRGTLIFSTCTIAKEENEENMMWFLKNYPFRLESLDPCLPKDLHSETTALGYLQLLPGVHKTDGFFLAKFRRK